MLQRYFATSMQRTWALLLTPAIALAFAFPAIAQTPPTPPSTPAFEVIEHLWNGSTVRMLKGALRVRLAPGSGLTAADVERAVPGVRVVGRYLLPNERTNVDFLREAPVNDIRLQDKLRAEDILVRTFDVTYSDARPPLDMAAYVVAMFKEIDYAEPWYVDELHQGPNDPRMNEQPGFALVRGPEAWQVFQGDSSVVIGISDSGGDLSHPDLVDNVHQRDAEIPDNGIDDDGNGYIDDFKGYNFSAAMDNTQPGDVRSSELHGSEVAGMAAARTNNGRGIAATGFRSKFFPIKVQLRNRSELLYGYHSLLYAARTGLAVLNLSWGRAGPRPASPIEQALVDYAIASNVVLVASGGNHGGNLLDRNYPSAYEGVLGVAEANSNDVIRSSSGLGSSIGIIAPSNGSVTTTGLSAEAYAAQSGTSFAAPMVSGMCAVIRARLPLLSARQVSALAKHCVVDVRSKNPSIAKGLPGRMDMMLAVTIDPDTVVAVECSRASLVDEAGEPLVAIPANSRYYVQVRVENALFATASNVRVAFSTLDDGNWKATWGDSVIDVGTLDGGALQVHRTAWFTSPNASRLPLAVLATITADGVAPIERVLVFNPVADFMIVENQALSIGVSGRAAVGRYAAPVNDVGPGLFLKPSETMISHSGLVVVANHTQGARALTYDFNTSDFRPVGISQEPGVLHLDVADSAAPVLSRTNVLVSTKWSFPSDTVPLATIDVVLTNSTDDDMVDMGAGLIMDWDVSSSGAQNESAPAPGAIPDVADNAGTAMQAFWRRGFTTAVVAGVVSADPDARAQNGAESLRLVAGPPLTPELLNDLFTRGTSMQPTTAGDLAGLHGVRFQGITPAGGTRSFTIVFALGSTVEQASQMVYNHLLPTSVTNDNAKQNLSLAPNPARDYITVDGLATDAPYQLVDVVGVVVKKGTAHAGRTAIDVQGLPSGLYRLLFDVREGTIGSSIVVVAK